MQTQLDEIKSKFHDLQKEHKVRFFSRNEPQKLKIQLEILQQEGGEKLNECKAERGRCQTETERLKKRLYAIETDNTELKRRLLVKNQGLFLTFNG